MDKEQIIHDIACAMLPVEYQQHIANDGKPAEFDTVEEYKHLVNDLRNNKYFKDM